MIWGVFFEKFYKGEEIGIKEKVELKRNVVVLSVLEVVVLEK